jgi:type II secretory pathway component PulM
VRTTATTSTTIARPVQQQRDADRVQILQAELDRERERLAQLTQQLRELQSSAPDATGARRPETLALSQAIRRSETDLQALDKELARTLR